MIEQAGLVKVARRRTGGFSPGMRQRLGIAAALLGDPPVLMLDEPFNGMDPEGTREMRGFLRALAAEGRAVLVSSHLMSELQDTAGHLVVAGGGKVIADASVADLIAAASGDGVTLRTAGGTIWLLLVISGEYSTGMIRTTLTAMPRRTTVLRAAAGSVLYLALIALLSLGAATAVRGHRGRARPAVPLPDHCSPP